MESTEKLLFEEGKIYFFICYALVCGGKSTFFSEIISQTSTEETKEKYNVSFVSSDEIRSQLAHDLQKKNPEMTFQNCFDKVGKTTAKEFDKQIKNAIDNKQDNKINIILVDKNYPNGIDKFLSLFCKDKNNQYFIVFTPNIKTPIKLEHLWFPFSINYVIQCYLRLKNRHGHENLNGEDENSKYVYISFLKLFQGFNFNKKVCKDDSFKSNVFLHTIDFTDESKEINIDKETEEFFMNVMKKIRAFDIEKIMANHKEEVEKYFKYIEDKYDGANNIFEDTRGKIKEEVSDILKNGIDIKKEENVQKEVEDEEKNENKNKKKKYC